MKTKIIVLPVLAVLLLAAGCSKGSDQQGEEQAAIDAEFEQKNVLPKSAGGIDVGNWKNLQATGYSLTYPPYLTLSSKSSGKTVNVTFTDKVLNGKISSSEIPTPEKFALPVSRVNIMLDKQPGTLEILDSGADLDRVVKSSVTSPGGQTYYFEFTFTKSEQDPSHVKTMLETVREILNSLRFK